MPAEGAPDEERSGVGGENREEHSHDRPEPVVGDVADEEQAADPRADPGDAEDRHAERRRRGLAEPREAVDGEREDERREEPRQHPVGTAELQAEQHAGEPEVAAQHERPERPAP